MDKHSRLQEAILYMEFVHYDSLFPKKVYMLKDYIYFDIVKDIFCKDPIILECEDYMIKHKDTLLKIKPYFDFIYFKCLLTYMYWNSNNELVRYQLSIRKLNDITHYLDNRIYYMRGKIIVPNRFMYININDLYLSPFMHSLSKLFTLFTLLDYNVVLLNNDTILYPEMNKIIHTNRSLKIVYGQLSNDQKDIFISPNKQNGYKPYVVYMNAIPYRMDFRQFNKYLIYPYVTHPCSMKSYRDIYIETYS